MHPAPAPPSSSAATNRVAVLIAGDATCLEPAASLARELDLPLIDVPSPDFDLLLAWTGRRLELRDNRDPRVGSVYAAFSRLMPGRRLTAREPLVRAIGKQARYVVDATLGLGADAWRLADYGYEVLGIERHPVIAALVRDALERAGHPNANRIVTGENANGASLHRVHRLQDAVEGPGAGMSRLGFRLHPVGDARDILPTLDLAPDVVLIDPMFPPKRRRSAAVSKEMRLLRALAGADTDAAELFDIACRVARTRVVVKRPDHADPLAPNPTVSYGGKLVRYDVYRLDLRRSA